MGFDAKVICTEVSVNERLMVSLGVWNSPRQRAGRERAAPSAQLAGGVPNNAKHVAVPFAVALWPYHMWIVPLIAYYVYEMSNKMPSSFLWFQLSATALLFPAALGTHTELKGSPYLCYLCAHMEVAARDKPEGDFPFLLGLRHKDWVCFALFFTLFFFFLMRCTMKGGKANLIIKPCLPPLSVFPDWEVQSFPLWCKNEFSSIHFKIIIYLKWKEITFSSVTVSSPVRTARGENKAAAL